MLIIQFAPEEFLKLGFPDAEISIMRAHTHTHTHTHTTLHINVYVTSSSMVTSICFSFLRLPFGLLESNICCQHKLGFSLGFLKFLI